jgi:cellulose synthase/poly-beta-1,6-N-acetylglucosamine synthase-like glycosyltransferase
VTVVIPSYNEQANITRITQQVLDEPWSDALALDQIIIVDDHSSDDTQALSEGLAGRYEQVRVIRHADRLGKNAGMRSGVLACRSDIVAFIDADVLLAPKCLTMTLQPLLDDRSLVASSALHEPLPPRSWRERPSRFQALVAAEMAILGSGSLARVYAMKTAAIKTLVLPDTLPDDFYIMRWLHDRGYRFAVRSDARFYIRAATGLRDFAKQTIRIWQAGEAVRRAWPGPGLSPPPKGVVARAIARAIVQEPLGFVLYVAWRLVITATPSVWWVPVPDHSRYDTSLSTKDLGL